MARNTLKTKEEGVKSEVTMASFREEFQLQNFWLNYPTRKHFTTSPWLPLKWFVLYRGAVCVFCSTLLLVVTINRGQGYSLAFTTWSFVTINFYFVCAFLLSAIELYGQRRSNNKPRQSQSIEKNKVSSQHDNKGTTEEHQLGTETEPTQGVVGRDSNNDLESVEPQPPPEAPADMTAAHKIQWILFNVAANSAVIVTLGYWCLLFPFIGAKYRAVHGPSGFVNVTVHLLNAIMMLTEIWVSALPVRLLHVIYPAIYGIIYVLMTLVLWLITKGYIYYFLDFNQPGFAVGFIVVLLFIVQPLVQLMYYGLYSLRRRLERSFRGSYP